MKRVCMFVIAIALVLAGCGGGGGSSSVKGGHVNIVLWHGYTGTEATAMKTLTQEFNATHPNITVTEQFYGNSDYALQKVLAAIAGGKPPDISYLYGSWAANIATNPTTVNLTPYTNQFDWNDFWLAERHVATVNGRVIGIPALVDNLALVYNKRLFAQAHLAPPDVQLDVERLRERGDQVDQPIDEAVRMGVRERR